MKRRILLSLVMLAMLTTITSMGTTQSDDDFKQEFLDRINRVRLAGCKCGTQKMPPVPPLVWNDDLEDAAAGHAKDMSRNNYFNHQSKDGRGIQNRIMNAGYTYKGFKSFAVGENIAFGQESIEEVQNGWFKSEGHCRNLMNPDFKEVGVARYGKHWVQDFGGRETFSAQEQKMIKKGARVIMRRG